MDFFEVVARRFSARSYQHKLVDESALKRILQTANDAPSAFNAQAYEIVVVRDAARKQRLARACWSQMFVAEAPVVLVFFANPDRNREKLGPEGADVYSHEDAVIACAHAHLAAAALGLGGCWIAAYGQKAVNETVGVPAGWRAVALLTVGHPAEEQPQRVRRSLDELAKEV
jgi:nitroreductase